VFLMWLLMIRQRCVSHAVVDEQAVCVAGSVYVVYVLSEVCRYVRSVYVLPEVCMCC